MNNQDLKQQIALQKSNIVKLGAKRSSMQSSLVSLNSHLEKETIKEIEQQIKDMDFLLKEKFAKLKQLEKRLQGADSNE